SQALFEERAARFPFSSEIFLDTSSTHSDNGACIASVLTVRTPESQPRVCDGSAGVEQRRWSEKGTLRLKTGLSCSGKKRLGGNSVRHKPCWRPRACPVEVHAGFYRRQLPSARRPRACPVEAHAGFYGGLLGRPPA